ncbi:DEAD/DEAH box helicase [Parashewanella curva]|uniref:DEAD/DEAH box helicase n=1 Tax=Parashewanella curva TaxID=2338552 RepID=A0A3L8Q305_9GAMM|nr:DEAD/DEAH box helicase [Parashewanella curva]RLV61353.1 DEAD/DEAH box helicase [Parashewanella curva]
MNFESFSFPEALLRGVTEYGYKNLTPIQQKAIPVIRRGHDVIANAQTGTGKTAAFALPILQKLIENPKAVAKANCQAVILTPTRELAAQIADNINAYTHYLELSIVTVYGGTKMQPQALKLREGADIIIATPGRLLEHLIGGNISLANIDYLVLDEADRMLDMGFSTDIHKILQATSKQKQSMLFSATFNGSVKRLANELMKNPKIVSVGKQNTTAETVSQVVYPVEQRRKRELLSELIGKKNWQRVLVFSATREDTDRLTKELNLDGIPTKAIHSEKNQGNRRRALREFTEGKLQVLVSTEVAARGLDIPNLEYVVNYDLPFLAEDYVHRIGRTGRAGKTGVAISFVSREEERTLKDIEKLIGFKLKRIMVPGYEVSSRDLLLKQLQKRRSFSKNRERSDNVREQIVAEKSMSGRRVKVNATKKAKK